LAGRIAMLDGDPVAARDYFKEAVELAQYQESHSAERILREAVAIFHWHRYAVPLKDATDIQWLMGVHPVQMRQSAWDDDDTWASVTEKKRIFDYIRYFPLKHFLTERSKCYAANVSGQSYAQIVSLSISCPPNKA